MRKILLLAVALCLVVPTAAKAQCNGQTASGNLCGNSGASQGLPQLTTPSAVFDKAFGATSGLALFRGNSGWTASVGLVLGTNGGTGGSVTLNGSTSGSAAISVPAAAGTTTFQLPATNGSANFILQTDGSGHLSWTAAGGGTVSSVALAMPSIFAVSGSPVTSTGTLTAAFNTQSANLIFGGPSSGIAATPTFRALVGADLPNPTTSSLGGIQAINAVASNWIKSINTSGVPQLSQPAFTDISGTLAATQCPDPTASTLGCIESYVAVAHQWINAISISGVPSSTQPTFADLSGNATLSQLPSISNNSILANNSGGTSVPGTLTTSQVLDMIDNTQGDILYRGATSWNFLGPGTSGQVLSTGGAAANPSWTTVTGTGTVTSIATNNGITGGTITTSGTIGLASITAHTVLANTTGAGAVPTASTPSSILDIIGSATGDVLYRAAGGWQVLAPGTNGQVLTQGASTPSWSNAGTLTNVTISTSGILSNSGTCNITTSGTCTVTGTAASKSDQQAAASTTLVVTPSQQQSHPSAAKAWAYCSNSLGTYTLQASYNISGGTCGKTGTGVLQLTFATAFSSAQYACTASISDSFPEIATTITVSSSVVQVNLWNTSGTAINDNFTLVCYGTQ